jgi:subtilisin family serine protease
VSPIRVAVIDSGVHADHPHVGGVSGGIGINADGSEHDDYVDRLGHGTAVTAVIREKAPNAEIVAIKVFDRELSATGVALVAACRAALRERAGIVNLSLGTKNPAHEDVLRTVVNELRASGVLIVAAGEQEGVHWLPGSLDGVCAVTLDWSLDRNEIRSSVDAAGRTRYRASGYPRPIPGVGVEDNLKGLSFAVANVTGILASRGSAGQPIASRSDRILRS